MADPVNYGRPGVSAQKAADEMAQYAARIAASKRMVAQEDRAAAAAGDQYAASLQRQVAAAREVATVTGQAAAAVGADAAARRGAAAATEAQNATLRQQLRLLREQTGLRLTGPQATALRNIAATGAPNQTSSRPFQNLEAMGLVARGGGRANLTPQGTAALAALNGETAARKEAAAATDQQAAADAREATTARENAAAQQQAAVAARERMAAMQQAAFATPSGTGRPLPMFMGGGGAGGGGRPPAPPIPPGGGAGGEPPGSASGAEATAASKAAMAERELASIRAAAGGQAASLSRDMRSYGALTSEFFAALARGEVTVSELGFQAAITGAKFGAWTAAAGIIYGVVGAIRELKDGAVEAQSGVATLTRFIPNMNQGRAYQDLVNTSNEFVEPVKNVAEAQAAFARVTHDQTGSLTAARTAILATKLDNINLADSYRYLIAIMQEFQIPATQLPAVFDQISAAQRQMGARVQEVLPALAKSVGAVRTQGGDFSQLLALITVAQTTSGQTGNLIGQAFSRGAANFYNSPGKLRNVGISPLDIEKQYGIDTSLGFTQRMIQAIQKASASKDLKEQQLLSQAFFGPLRGGLLAGVFRQAPRLEEAGIKTGPGAAAGSTMDEWTHQAGRADLQISALRIHMQNLGAELAKSGALQPFGWIVYGGNQALRVVEAMVHAFGQLPGPMKTALEAGVAFLAVMKGMGAFAGGALLNRVPLLGGVFGNPDRQYQAQLTSGLRTGVESSQVSAGRIAAQGEAAAFQAEMDTKAYTLQAGRVDRLRASGVAGEQLAGEEAKLAELETEMSASMEAAAAAGQRTILAKQAYAAQQAELAAIENMTPGQAAAYGQSRNMAVRQGFGQEAAVAPLATMEAGGMASQASTMKQVMAGSVQSTSQISALAAIKARYKIQTAAETEGYANYSRSARGVIAQETGAISATERAAAETGAVASATNSLRGGMGFLTGHLGGITIGLMAAFLGYQQLKSEMDKYDKAQKRVADAMKGDLSTGQGQAQLVAALKHADDVQTNVFTQAAHHIDVFFTDLANKLNKFFGGGQPDWLKKLQAPGAKPTDWTAAVRKAEAPQTTGPLGWLAAGGATALTGGGAAALMAITGIHPHVNEQNQDQIGATAKLATASVNDVWNSLVQQVKDAEAVNNGTAASQRKAADAVAWARSAARNNPAFQALQILDPKGAAALLSSIDQQFQAAVQHRRDELTAIAGVQIGQRDPFTNLENQSSKNLGGAMDVYSSKITAYGYDPDIVKKMAYTYTFIADKYAKSNNPDDLRVVDSARTQYVDAVRNSVQQLVDQANATSNKGERARLLNEAKALVASQKGILQNARDELQVAISKRQADLTTAQAALAAAQAAHVFGDRTFVKALQAYVTAEKRIAGFVVQGTIGILRTVPEFVQSAASMDAAEGALQGTVGNAQKALNGLANNLAAVGKANANIANAFSAPLKSLNSQLNQATKQPTVPASQDPFELTRLQRELEQARAWGDPVKQAQIAEQLAQQEISAARNQHERLQGQIDLAKAQQQYDQAVQDAAQARFEYLKSLTTDPIKQAQIDVSAARQQVQFDASHGGLSTAQGYRDRAKLNTANQNLVDQRVSEREQTIEFNLKLQKISTETAIQEYQALLNIHGITKRTRQEVLSKIWDLQHAGQGDFGALDLGTIRIPTPYEIRRAVLAAQAGISVTNHNSVTVQVPDERTAGSVGTVMERVTGAPLTSTMRAAGMR